MEAKKKSEQFNVEEAQRRFDAALRGARDAGHKPQLTKAAKPNVPLKQSKNRTKP
jgi:hypothetical protein